MLIQVFQDSFIAIDNKLNFRASLNLDLSGRWGFGFVKL
jgi:hypothetical protein